MPIRDEKEQELKRDGYTQVTVHKDPPDFEYPQHDHPVDTAYVVLNGEMMVRMDGTEYSLKAGERLDIRKYVAHFARMGKQGCEFLVGVKV